MKLIIAGSRTFTHHSRHLLDDYMKRFVEKWPLEELEIVSGGAEGADCHGERWADTHDVNLVKFLPNWGRYGKAAGPMRNARMAAYADAAVVFWDGVSRGSADMIEQMRQAEKFCKVIRFTPETSTTHAKRPSKSAPSAGSAKKPRASSP